MLRVVVVAVVVAAAACAREAPPIAPVRVELAARNPDRLRLIIAGDLHTRGPERIGDAIRHVHERNPVDAIILTGDNFDPCGVTSLADPQWQGIVRHLSPIGVPMYPVLGNHDYGNPKTRMGMTVICGQPDVNAQIAASSGIPNWRFPARNYVVSSPLADIVMVDTTPVAMNRSEPVLGSAVAESVKTFAAERLRAAGTGKWRIVAGHHNARYSGKQRWKSASTRRHMDAFYETLTSAGADLYLCGHQHQLELIMPLGKRPAMLISGAAWRPKRDEALTAEIDEDAHFLTNRAGFATLEIDGRSARVLFHDESGQAISNVITVSRTR